MILAAYSCPVVIFIHLLTTENAPLETKTEQSVSPTETLHCHYQLTGCTEGCDVARILKKIKRDFLTVTVSIDFIQLNSELCGVEAV